MQYLDLTLPTPAENLALDEALLEEAEAADRARRNASPVGAAAAAGRGGAIVAGGCRGADRGVPGIGHSRAAPPKRRGGRGHRAGLPDVRPGAELPPAAGAARRHRGPSLGVGHVGRGAGGLCAGRSVPGHERSGLGRVEVLGQQRPLRRNHLLYHGTLLYDFPLELIERLLAMPPRMPEYRGGRPHEGFVTNLPLDRETIRQALLAAFDAREPRDAWPEAANRPTRRREVRPAGVERAAVVIHTDGVPADSLSLANASARQESTLSRS